MKTLLSELSISRAAQVVLALTIPFLGAQVATAQTNTFPSSGSAGVGTTTPVSPLEVQAPDGPITLSQSGVAAKVTLQAGIGTDLHMSANAKYSNSAWNRYDTSMPSWNFFLAPSAGADYAGLRRASAASGAITWTDLIRITNTGNVGIGTTSPAQYSLLHLYSTASTGTGLRIENGDSGGRGFRLLSTGSGNTGGTGKFHIFDENASAFRLSIDSSGNVGIGTTNPAVTLHVTAGNADAITRVAQFYQPGLSSNNNYAFVSVGKANVADQAAAFGFLMNTAGNDSAFMTVAGDDPSVGTGLFVKKGGNVGIGIASPTEKLHVAGNGKFTGNLTVDGNLAAKYQDVAEWVPSSEQLSAATVVVLDSTKSNEVIASSQAYDTRVAGVISAQPGITLGEKSDTKVLVATTGRVRVKVDATKSPIAIGDLLVTSDVPGVAMKSEAVNLGGVQIHRPGTIIGKALEPLMKGSGEILVLLSLQ